MLFQIAYPQLVAFIGVIANIWRRLEFSNLSAFWADFSNTTWFYVHGQSVARASLNLWNILKRIRQ